MTTRYTEGGVTVTLDDGIEKLIRAVVDAAAGETVAIMEREAKAVAAAARAAWYGPRGVTRVTGLSGDIQVTTTVNVDRGEVRVSVGSTDTRIAGKSGKPVPLFVHRPFATSTMLVEVDRSAWYAVPRTSRGPILLVGDKVYRPSRDGKKKGMSLRYMVYRPSPGASDGKFQVAELINQPIRRKIVEITPEIGRSIAARVTRG